MKVGVIKSSWIHLSPGGRIDARYWLKVNEALEALGHDPSSAGEVEVKAAIAKVETNIQAAKETARQKRAAANTLVEEARAIEEAADIDLLPKRRS